METFMCQECGVEFEETELDPEAFAQGDYYCRSCSHFAMQKGWDIVEPDYDMDQFDNWVERGD